MIIMSGILAEHLRFIVSFCQKLGRMTGRTGMSYVSRKDTESESFLASLASWSGGVSISEYKGGYSFVEPGGDLYTWSSLHLSKPHLVGSFPMLRELNGPNIKSELTQA